jgi:hypothetical protein
MGYRVDASATLVLEGYEGAEVTVSIGVPLHALVEWDTAENHTEEWPIFVRWARPAWDLEDAEGPIPPDEDAIRRLPLPMLRTIMRAWRQAAVNPPAPLPQPSSDTEPSAA